MAIPARFERAAYGLGNRCSILLSYGIVTRRNTGRPLQPQDGRPVFWRMLRDRPLSPGLWRRRAALLDAAADRRERGLQAGTHRRHGGDDHDCDERGDQAIFDCRRAGLVADETIEDLHWKYPLRCVQKNQTRSSM